MALHAAAVDGARLVPVIEGQLGARQDVPGCEERHVGGGDVQAVVVHQLLL